MTDSSRRHDVEALRHTADEVRSVLDHQIRTFNDVDNKAAATFRIEAILLGLLLTAASFATRSETITLSDHVNGFSIAGVILLELSFVLAIAVYTTTKIQTGLGPSSIQRLIDTKYDEREWLVLLLRSSEEWMQFNQRQQTINGVLLTLSHAALILAIVSITIGVGRPFVGGP